MSAILGFVTSKRYWQLVLLNVGVSFLFLLLFWGTTFSTELDFFIPSILLASLLYPLLYHLIGDRGSPISFLLFAGLLFLLPASLIFLLAWSMQAPRILSMGLYIISILLYTSVAFPAYRARGVAMLFSLGLSFLLVEGYLEFIHDPYAVATDDRQREVIGLHETLDYLPLPNAQLEAEYIDSEGDTHTIEYRYNDMGLRDEDFPVVPAEQQSRIIVTGDSLIAGVSVNSEDTIPKQIEVSLKAMVTDADYAVLNWGVGGYSLAQQYELIEYFDLAQYQPDLWIASIYLNDFEQSLDPNIFLEETGAVATQFTQDQILADQEATNWNGIRQTRTYRLLRETFTTLLEDAGSTDNPPSDQNYLYDPARDDDFKDAVNAQISALYAYAQANDIKLAFVLIPSEIALGNDPDPQRYGVYQFFVDELNSRDAPWLDLHEFVDMRTQEVGRRLYLVDDVSHFTAEGNAFAGERIAEFIVSTFPELVAP